MSEPSHSSPSSWPAWSGWERLPLRLDARVLRLVLDDGQAFRWHALADDSWLGIWDRHLVRLAREADGTLLWSAPDASATAAGRALHGYLALDTPYPELTDSLPWRSDPHLARCIAATPGLRLLKQPFGETLLCFLCSSTKQIPQIKLMADAMAALAGDPIAARLPPGAAPAALTLRTLPSWERLASVPEAGLRGCGLGFRAANVVGTARFLAERPGWLAETEHLPYAEAHARLCELPGVGAKIADCVLLYGGGFLEAFPVDTWILKAMARRYGLEGWKPDQVALFGRTHFGACAGIAEQLLFNYERHAD